jgi:hypothetical protein
MEVQARRLGSPLDSIITLFNSQGGQLAEQDDSDMGDPLLTHHADSRLDYTFPSDGDYVLRIQDAQGRGGEECAYRLHIVPPRPDFSLRTVPDNPRLGQTDSVPVTVKALRQDGFNSEIDLTVQNLPKGFVASKAVIPAGQSETRLTITAPPDAPVGLASPTIVGTATLGEQTAGKPSAPKTSCRHLASGTMFPPKNFWWRSSSRLTSHCPRTSRQPTYEKFAKRVSFSWS